MAIDPARMQRRAIEAEQSGRRPLGVGEAAEVLRTLAVVIDGGPPEQPSGDPAALQQAS
ncbi:hypothetical protein [Streptomyces sp. NPDC059378]|uniref:hypothetical protein n=1 Tax=Streptomyces sp. NPDC059378 TaxID=3346815 RepID=UPI00369F62D4